MIILVFGIIPNNHRHSNISLYFFFMTIKYISYDQCGVRIAQINHDKETFMYLLCMTIKNIIGDLRGVSIVTYNP